MSDTSGVDPTLDFGGGDDSGGTTTGTVGPGAAPGGSPDFSLGNIFSGIIKVGSAIGTAGTSVSSVGSGISQLLGISSSTPSWTWGQLFGNVGLIILGIVLIGVSLAVGSHETVIKISKDALK